jgi:hypothetical protein
MNARGVKIVIQTFGVVGTVVACRICKWQRGKYYQRGTSNDTMHAAHDWAKGHLWRVHRIRWRTRRSGIRQTD